MNDRITCIFFRYVAFFVISFLLPCRQWLLYNHREDRIQRLSPRTCPNLQNEVFCFVYYCLPPAFASGHDQQKPTPNTHHQDQVAEHYVTPCRRPFQAVFCQHLPWSGYSAAHSQNCWVLHDGLRQNGNRAVTKRAVTLHLAQIISSSNSPMLVDVHDMCYC
jgi:hypothetical protein